VQTKELNVAEIEEWLSANQKRPAWLAQTLGVSHPTVSRWLKGQEIPEPMQHLIKLLIRGEVPPGFMKPQDPAILSFTPEEWRIMEIWRLREGFSDVKAWIAAKIRAYLAMNKAVRYPTADEDPYAPQALKVAEDEATYHTGTTGK
jgi:hypothetical protein